jgi:ferrochelatase
VGDDEPYQSQCLVTANLIAKELGLSDEMYKIVFQSRFGKAEWIQPYLAQTLEQYPLEGIKDIQVFCPGFVSDCLETIEEIGQESRELFMDSGGLKYDFIPCLNGDEGLLDTLRELIINHGNYSVEYKNLL